MAQLRHGTGLDLVIASLACSNPALPATADACAEVFAGPVPNPSSAEGTIDTTGHWYTQDKTSPVDNLVVSEFIEGGLDLTNLLGNGNINDTPCFGTFLADTRSSQEFSATIRAAVANDDLAAVVRAGRLDANPEAADALMGLAAAFAA